MMETLTDYITGKTIPNTGAEANRQQFEKILVENKGFKKSRIRVDADIEVKIRKETYRSKIDLIITVKGCDYMAVKCAPGSLGSREREILAAARLYGPYQIPVSVVTDGRTAIVMDTVTGKKTGEGLSAIPDAETARKAMDICEKTALAEKRSEKEKLIFRSYDSMNVNRG